MNQQNIDEQIQNEINNIIIEHWSFLNENWPIIIHKYKHRTNIKHIKFINKIKEILVNKLGYISVFYFLIILYTNKEYPGPYFEIEKGLFLLFHLTSGICGKEEIDKYLPQSTFHIFYKKFWADDKNYERIEKIVDNALKNMCSNVKLRILSARKNNPDLFKHVTLILDGHDSRINYTDMEIDHSRLYSYKLKKSGLRTQIISDINDIIIYISKSNFCTDCNDGTMFLDMKLYRKISNGDTIAVDGGYTLFINQFLENANKKGFLFTSNNFIHPIRKNVNDNLSITEEHFNKTFGSFRSKIETQFSMIGGKFRRFNNSKTITKITKSDHYNLQFKVACLLKNIQKFVDLFNIPTYPHHKLWASDNFEFPIERKLIDIVVSNEKENKKKLNEMLELQNNILNLNIEDNNRMIIDEYSENEEDNIEYNKASISDNNEQGKKRKIRKKTNKSYTTYEIELICGHKIENNIMKFNVKWKNYPETENSWLTIDKFNHKTLLSEYINKNNLGLL